MGKIVKFCSSCDEGFAEKFGFCPNCGAGLQAFEMNPLEAAAPPVEVVAATVIAEPVAVEPVEVFAEAVEEPVLEIDQPGIDAEPEMIAAAEPVVEVIQEATPEVIEEPAFEAPAPMAASAFVQTKAIHADRKRASYKVTPIKNDGFNITIVEERAGNTRNVLLAGATGFMVFALMTGLVINLFSKDLQVGSIGDDMFLASLIDEVPMTVEEEIEKKNKEDGGGGGGGGREEEEETTRGDLANQTEKPIRPPDAKVHRMDDPSLLMPPPSTQGNQTFEKKFNKWGDPNGRFDSFSNGTGSGGGQGSGTGTGQGSGRGTGAGSGTGSGYGGGLGSGNGNGTGAGDGESGPPPEIKRGVTQGLKIISRPKPGYTDAARTNNIQGQVVLRVTFLGSGQIGSISTVKGLPNGLTEKAIAAARGIVFEPAKTNGVGQTIVRSVEYTFAIY